MDELFSLKDCNTSPQNEIACILARGIIRKQQRCQNKAPYRLDNTATLCLYNNIPEKTTETDYE